MKSSAIFILLLSSLFLKAQFDQNFEFLDHKELVYDSSLPMLFENKLYFVSHLANTGGTVIYCLDNDNNLEVIYRTGLSSRAKLGYVSDSSFQILLEKLIDWDFLASGFISITIDKNESVKVDEFHRYNTQSDSTCITNWNNYSSGTCGFLDEDKWVYASVDSMFGIQNGCIIQSTQFNGDSNNRLLNDSSRNLYLLSGTLAQTSISQIDTALQVTSLDTLPGQYSYITSNQLNSFFLYDRFGSSTLLEYNPSSGTIKNQWILPSRTDLSHVYMKGENPLLSIRDSGVSHVLKGMENGVLDTFTQFKSEGLNERYTGVFSGGDEQLLYLGLLQESILRHSFIRNIDTKENDESKYDRIDMDICLFDLELTDWELESIVLDSIELYFMDYEADIEICNNSSDTIYHTDLWLGIDPRYTGSYSILENITPAGNYSFSTEISFYGEVRNSLTIIATGANYKFNNSLENTSTNYMVATKEQTIEVNEIEVYPNPSDGFIFFQSPSEIETIVVHDINGSVLNSVGNINQSKIDLSEYQSGIYILMFVQKDGGSITKKVVKI